MPATEHILAVQVALENDSGLPRDRAINTWHFQTSHPTTVATSTELDEVVAHVKAFYDTAHTGSTNALAALLSAALSGAWSMKIYDLHDATPRVPVRDTGPLAAFTPGTTTLPAEVALCLSFQAARVSGVDQRHRRGRAYIGPLASNSVIVTGTGKPSTSANAIVQTLVAAGGFMKLSTTSDVAQVVYSPTLDAAADVANGWVDDEFDTQRRRGYRPSVRTTY